LFIILLAQFDVIITDEEFQLAMTVLHITKQTYEKINLQC